MTTLAAGEISALVHAAKEFQIQLQLLKNSLPEVEWYRHPSLSALEHLDATLTERRRYLLNLIGEGPVLDIGCGDGDLSFFLESLGCKVRAVDYSPTNYNRMRGVRRLKEALGSSVEISELDLDSQFQLPPDARYTAVFLLGVLYHLKNPFYVLEMLANHAGYCFLSTRIAQWTPDKRVNLARLPVAYLLKKAEANSDSTNFWIFSDAGLRELCDRTNWEVCDYSTFGNSTDSDPVSADGDERAFCLLRSKVVAATDLGTELISGWYGLEPGGWRWTQKRFSIAFPNPARGAEGRIELAFWLHDMILDALGAVTVRGSVGACGLPPQTFRIPGLYTYQARIPAEALKEDRVTVDFEVDKALPPGATDLRELALAVVSVEFS
jgi:2-polyprenyl-3-methyl-5-hydroxy-6-metoxy-1,4-benzoquinol methylase